MSRLFHRLAIAGLLTITSLLTLAVSGPAFAHAHLKAASPAADATVATTAELDLSFSEGIDLKFSGITITGPDKAAVATDTAKLDPANKARLIVPLSKPLTAGQYHVEWHVLSTDGHKTKGEYSFTVKP